MQIGVSGLIRVEGNSFDSDAKGTGGGDETFARVGRSIEGIEVFGLKRIFILIDFLKRNDENVL